MDSGAIKRLADILGMLGSEHDGEVLNAAKLAERHRRMLGKEWTDLLRPEIEAAQTRPPRSAAPQTRATKSNPFQRSPEQMAKDAERQLQSELAVIAMLLLAPMTLRAIKDRIGLFGIGLDHGRLKEIAERHGYTIAPDPLPKTFGAAVYTLCAP